MKSISFVSLLLCAVMSATGCSSSKNGGIIGAITGKNKVSPVDKAKVKNVEGLQICAQNNYAGAIAYFTQAVELDEKPEYYSNLGRCYYWVGRHGDALRAFARAEELGGNEPDLKANIGDVFRQRGDRGAAMKYYHQSISIDANFARGHYELANMLLKEGQYQDAIARLNRVLEIVPGDSKALVARLVCYRMTRQFKQAYRDMRDLDRRGYAVQEDLRREVMAGLRKPAADKIFAAAR